MSAMNNFTTFKALLLPTTYQRCVTRTAVVFTRQYEVPLVKLDKPVDSRRLRERHFVYDVVDITKPTDPVECILTRDIDGVGYEGTILSVRRRTFYDKLFPEGSAVHASPENRELYANKAAIQSTKTRRTINALQTFRLLSGMNLKIPMNTRAKWSLNSSHVQVALRMAGIYVENVDSITVPQDPPITNKHDQQVPFTVKVKINGLDEAEVTCYIIRVSQNLSLRGRLSRPDVPTFRPTAEVSKELMDKGIYYGTVDLS